LQANTKNKNSCLDEWMSIFYLLFPHEIITELNKIHGFVIGL
jgi:hypothetical protein